MKTLELPQDRLLGRLVPLDSVGEPDCNAPSINNVYDCVLWIKGGYSTIVKMILVLH